MDSGEWQELEVQGHPKQQPPVQQEQAQREAYEKGNRDDRPQRYRVRVSARKSGGDVVSALNPRAWEFRDKNVTGPSRHVKPSCRWRFLALSSETSTLVPTRHPCSRFGKISNPI